MDVPSCIKCHVTKPLSEFYQSTTCKSGYRSTCKQCMSLAQQTPERKAYTQVWRLKNATHLKQAKHDYYQSNKPRIRKQHQEYYYDNYSEMLSYHRDYRVRNQAKRLAYNLLYNAAHPEVGQVVRARRRAQKRTSANYHITAAQWTEIKAAYDSCCVYCGRQMQRLTMDHITPLAKGGKHVIENIVPACRACNSKKNDNPPPIPVQPLLLTVAPPRAKRPKKAA